MVQPIPGSLSEGAVTPKGLTEGVSPDEWERLNIQSFVGAMKIARNPTVSQAPG